MYVNVKYYLICVKLFKNAIKFVTVNDNVFQLLGDFGTPTGAPPLDPAGGLPSPRPPRSWHVQF